jgi:outer membrane biosynthesis protein TonB
VTLGALLILGIVSISMFLDRKPPSPPILAEAPGGPPSEIPGAAVSSVGEAHALASTASAEAGQIDGVSASALHRVIPDVPESARRTIRGHIKISVRVSVDRDGSVSTVAAERGRSSAYFRRLATEAAEKWTFPPVNTPSPRLLRIRFEFSRDETTAVTLR